MSFRAELLRQLPSSSYQKLADKYGIPKATLWEYVNVPARTARAMSHSEKKSLAGKIRTRRKITSKGRPAKTYKEIAEEFGFSISFCRDIERNFTEAWNE